VQGIVLEVLYFGEGRQENLPPKKGQVYFFLGEYENG